MRYAFRHPFLAWRYFRAPAHIGKLLGLPAAQFKDWMEEARPITTRLRQEFARSQFAPGKVGGGSAADDKGPILYALVRALQADKVVETGVASGSSSCYILEAMAKNNRGHLISIDLPPPQWQGRDYAKVDNVGLPEGREPGWMVPAALRSRWELRLGETRELLPQLRSNAPWDLFFHDSEHSAEVMRFEFQEAWASLRPRGVLISDDVEWNDAFRDFAREKARPTAYVGTFGLLTLP